MHAGKCFLHDAAKRGCDHHDTVNRTWIDITPLLHPDCTTGLRKAIQRLATKLFLWQRANCTPVTHNQEFDNKLLFVIDQANSIEVHETQSEGRS
ncbi:hypothetical protein NPIL_253491 [Nephila pilipes]|uniref:Uncharacterized protein n=1 Tax=Nephila pilipes TaxID=299642 RepID=A0A8X6TPA0_NEPPI|nr:hypothetical protein NPIL_253491 [Nephila pilipes]